jgi:cysteine desulfurase family protein
MIYLDNAATSLPKPPAVGAAVVEALNTFAGVGRGVHPASLAAASCVFDAREAVAALLGTPSASRVAFVHNATAALNIAITSLLPTGGVAVTTAASHNSVLRPLFKARDERGVTVRVAGHTREGALVWEELEAALPGANVLVLTHASNLTGDVFDAARACALAHAHGVPVILDCAQTAGAYPVNQAALGADVVCFTGHKSLLGPQGTGGLAALATVEILPLMEGGSGTHSYDERHPRVMPDAAEAGTLNAHGLAGLLAGVTWVAEKGVEQICAHEQALAQTLAEGLAAAGARVLGVREPAASTGIVACTVGEEDSAAIADALAFDYGICTRAGAHCAPLMHKALGTQDTGAVRFSVGPFTTKEDIAATVEAFAQVVGA